MHTILGIIMIGLIAPILFASYEYNNFIEGFLWGLFFDFIVGLFIGGIYLLIN